eukprot:CAMPEP_0179856028 /NCGR_PEP_ID=MMETSP0982-20121206/10889_1 /TAXON_ID=483367 /ORGANISM="non described non described, Strain CCMP 2436" /LENGTH=62 /DNA_ID=CAMNT_0021742235 /DNA_START=155 /DNA_END=338 /DNA_ORIENTATION=-
MKLYAKNVLRSCEAQLGRLRVELYRLLLVLHHAGAIREPLAQAVLRLCEALPGLLPEEPRRL